MKFYLILIFVSFSFTQRFNQPNQKAPKELSQFQFMVGKWEGVRKTMQRDGSYATVKVKMISYYTYNGFGFHDEWYEDGNYWGTTVRIIDPKTKKWKNTFFNYKRNQNWGDFFYIEYKDGNFLRENKWSGGRFNLDRIRIEHMNKNHFTWSVDMSSDNGKTWQLKDIVFMDLKRIK